MAALTAETLQLQLDVMLMLPSGNNKHELEADPPLALKNRRLHIHHRSPLEPHIIDVVPKV